MSEKPPSSLIEPFNRPEMGDAPPKQRKPFNVRQTSFIREYLREGNATQSAIAAGYSRKTADRIGSRLLRRPDIQAEITAKALKLANAADVSVERVLKEYARIAFLNPQDLYDADGRLLNVKEMPEDAARAISGLEEEIIYGSDGDGGKADIGRLKKIKLTGKIPALEGLARHLGMFQDERTTLQQAFQIVIHVSREE